MNSFELFSGGGGLVLGMAKAGFNHLGLVEINKNACSTLRLNQELGCKALSEADIYESDAALVAYRKYAGKVDVVAGGPPCQPFSLGGKHKGFEDCRDMFPQAVRAVRELAPRAFIFENVKGLTRSSFAQYLEYIKLQLRFPELAAPRHGSWEDHLILLRAVRDNSTKANLSYDVSSMLVNAADYGVPQKRERIFIVGFREDLGISWKPPIATHSEERFFWDKYVSGTYWDTHCVDKLDNPKYSEKLKRAIERVERLGIPKLKPWKSVRDAFVGLPSPYKDKSDHHKFKNHEFRGGAKSYAGHTGSPYDEPAKALKAGAHGVPGGENMLAYSNGEVRYFSVRESARIQTFPDDYYFEGSWGEVMRQLGNAVPALLAEVMASSVYRQLETPKRRAQLVQGRPERQMSS
jgi:DNA (cytosine-5)-methyltransferase 1